MSISQPGSPERPGGRGDAPRADAGVGLAAAGGDPDAELMKEVAAGNEAAFGVLVEKWKRPLINFFYRSLNARETAEDLAQVTFVRLFRAAPGYTPSARFSTFLFHIARRLLINEFRRQKRKPLDPLDPAQLTAAADARGAAAGGTEALRVAELEDAFARTLQRLPEKHRTAILLLKQQELSYREIAAVMGASEGAVKTWIFRARKQLKEELKEWL